jgi:hypothetical protein
MLALTTFAEETKKNVPKTGDGIIEPGEDAKGELARATQNPVADLISVPFQWNVGFKSGPDDDRTASVLNVQPVIPLHLNDDLNLITRTILPIVNQPPVVPLGRQEWELGNLQFSAFFSPRKSECWIWGVGLIFEFPSHTNDVLASDNYSAGPTFVALRMQGPWVYGSLINQLWSFEGHDGEVNKMLIQPFVNYNLKDGWYLSSSPIITADWTRESNNRWTVPIGGGVGKIIKIGKTPVNISTQFFYHVESPRNGDEWSARFQLQFLFPK